MTIQSLRKAMRLGSATVIFAGLLSAASLASAASTQKPAAPAKAAAPAKPSGGSAASHAAPAGGSHGPAAGGTHTTTSGGAHGPTTGGARNTTTHTTTTTSHTTTNPGGARSTTVTRTSTTTRSSSFNGRPAPRGSNEHTTRSGGAIRTRANGRVADVHDARRGMDVHHGLAGGRRVEREMPGHGRIVSERGRRGYVQRGYGYHGHDFGLRAYFYHGHEYNRYYHGWGYRGLYLNVYAPGVFWGPAYYGWA